jgi:hypothetical protein
MEAEAVIGLELVALPAVVFHPFDSDGLLIEYVRAMRMDAPSRRKASSPAAATAATAAAPCAEFEDVCPVDGGPGSYDSMWSNSE